MASSTVRRSREAQEMARPSRAERKAHHQHE
jgi:hypothetical protein